MDRHRGRGRRHLATARRLGVATVRLFQGKWCLDYRDAQGRRHREVAGDGKSKRRAEHLLHQRIAEIDAGHYRAGGRRLRLADYAASWLMAIEPKVKPGTLTTYKTHVEHYVQDPKLGLARLRLASIGRPEIQAFQAAQAAAYPKLSARTRNMTVIILGTVLQSALRDGLIPSNPARLVSKLREQKREMDFLVPSEVHRLLAAALEVEGPAYALMIRLSVAAGLRRGELLALRWEDVDARARALKIRRAYGQTGFSSPKSPGSSRDVHVGRETIRELLEHRLRQGNPPEGGLIFDRGDGRPVSPGQVSFRSWRRVLAAAGLRRIRWHDLRHTYASLALSGGANLKFISSQLGHCGIQITLDRYSHLIPEDRQEAAQQFEDILFAQD